MGVAAYNRGSRHVTRETDKKMAEANKRAEQEALDAERAKLLARIEELERTLARARRCLAAERMGREELRRRLMTAQSNFEFGVGIMGRLLTRAGVPGWEK